MRTRRIHDNILYIEGEHDEIYAKIAYSTQIRILKVYFRMSIIFQLLKAGPTRQGLKVD